MAEHQKRPPLPPIGNQKAAASGKRIDGNSVGLPKKSGK